MDSGWPFSLQHIGFSKFLELKNTDGCSCHQLWLEVVVGVSGELWCIGFGALLQIPLCKQRSELIAQNGTRSGIGISFSQSCFQPLPRPSFLLGPITWGNLCIFLCKFYFSRLSQDPHLPWNFLNLTPWYNSTNLASTYHPHHKQESFIKWLTHKMHSTRHGSKVI